MNGAIDRCDNEARTTDLQPPIRSSRTRPVASPSHSTCVRAAVATRQDLSRAAPCSSFPLHA
eukprot:6155364-Prymnesium_polylepis.1